MVGSSALDTILELLTAVLVVACGLVVVVLCLPQRFSVRSLLIATTLVAIVLGTWCALRLW
jgi:hypothetical protein